MKAQDRRERVKAAFRAHDSRRCMECAMVVPTHKYGLRRCRTWKRLEVADWKARHRYVASRGTWEPRS